MLFGVGGLWTRCSGSSAFADILACGPSHRQSRPGRTVGARRTWGLGRSSPRARTNHHHHTTESDMACYLHDVRFTPWSSMKPVGKHRPACRLVPHSLHAPDKPKPDHASPLPITKPVPMPQAPPATALKPRPFLAILADKLLDTGDDVLMHLKRSLKPHPDGHHAVNNLRKEGNRLVYRSDRPVALVVGSGWASHSFMKVADIDKFDVVVCSPRNHFLFTPMLPSAAVGSVEPRSLLEPVRVANPHVAYFEASVDSIDLAAKVAHCSSSMVSSELNIPSISFDVPYDHVVVAVGEQPATFGIPGVLEHCFFMKEVQDAVRLRRRIQQQFELAEFMVDPEARADALRFVVVGGGPTGVEFAGTLSDFLFCDLVKRYPQLMEHVQVVLIQSDTSILTAFHQTLQRKAMENFDRLKVKVMTDVRVTEVKKNHLSLSTGEELGCGLCLWSAGNQTRPLVHQLIDQVPEQLALAHPRRASQKLAVDQYLRVIGVEGAFCLGDCSRMVTGPLPPTAQVAGQQGAYVARTINNSSIISKGGVNEPPPSHWVEGGKATEARHRFDFVSLGIMAYIGDSKAIVHVGEGGGIDVWGNLAFLLCRSVYIAKQVSTRNRVLLLLDWLKSRAFGRDLSIFH